MKEKGENNLRFKKTSFDYLNEQIKPIFLSIVSKAIKNKPNNSVRRLFQI